MFSTIPSYKDVYKKVYKVDRKDIDLLNHVNNIVYLQWIQNISGLHWNSLATSQMKDSLVWMVLQHKIDYLSQAFEGDEITMYTWVEKNEGVKSIRIVHIYKGDTLIVSSQTIWCLLDRKGLKPKRIDTAINALFDRN